MIVARGYGLDTEYIGSIVAHGFGRKLLEEIIIPAWHIVRDFVLRITQVYEVRLER
jgi:hypothetical protein